MSKFLNKKYLTLEAYTPGEQPKDMQYVKLNTNESPYPPSKKVLDAVSSAEVSKLNLYPDPECKELKQAMATLYGLDAKNVFLSNGSDDILNFFFMAFCDNEDHPVAYPNISYGFYSVYAKLHGAKAREIPLEKDFSINIENYCTNAENVVIANPNAPTGLALTLDQIEHLLVANPDRLVLIDEAYVDFGAESAVSLVPKYDNLLVVGTFSKSRSMAGARLGFAFANESIIADLEKIKYSTNPYNINRLTLLAGKAAVEDNGYYMDNCKKIQSARDYTIGKLHELGFTVTDSKANFIFAKTDAIAGEKLYLELKKRGILVRHFSNPLICEYNRITVGTDEQMKELLCEISNILERKIEL